MNLTNKKNFDIEVIISPVAMASLQTQFIVGNRQHFGFLYGEILISNDTYRCDDYTRPNTFYISSIMPVFDAASFQSDLLKCNDKTVSDTFRKYFVKNHKREPILGWYFEGNPNVLLRGKDYSLHVKLIRQILLLNQKMKDLLQSHVAYHAFFAAVVSYSKIHFSRDFSVGFQAFDEKNQLRMFDVKVNVVDHYYRPRLETDTCLINHSKILEFIRGEISSEEIQKVFDQLHESAFAHPEPECYNEHGRFVDRCFDLLGGLLKFYCSRASLSRNIELESQLFDYKTYDVDSKGYHTAMAIIDKTERNLNLFEIMRLLNTLDNDQPENKSAVSVVHVGQHSLEMSEPRMIANEAKRIRLSPQEALETTVNVSPVETRSRSPEKVIPHVVSSSFEKSHQNSKDAVIVQVEHSSLQQVHQSSKEVSPQEHIAVPKDKQSSRKKLDTQFEVSTAEPISQNTTKTTSDDDSSSKASNKNVSKSKKRRRKKKKRLASVASEQAQNVIQCSATAAADSVVLTSPEQQNLRNQSIEMKTSPFSNVPRDQLLIYNISSPNKSNEIKKSDLGLIPVHGNRICKPKEMNMSAAKVGLYNSDSSSVCSYTSEDEKENADSKTKEMQIRIVRRNTSARVKISHASSMNKTQNSTESIEKFGKKKDVPSEIGSQNRVHNSDVKSMKKSKTESKLKAISLNNFDSGEFLHSKNTSSSKNDKVEQNLVSVIQDVKHPDKKCKEGLKDESSKSGTYVFYGSTDGTGKSKLPINYGDASSSESEPALNQMFKSDRSKSSNLVNETRKESRALLNEKKQPPNKENVKETYRTLGKTKPDSVMSSLPDKFKNPPEWLQEITERTAQRIDKMIEDLALTQGATDLRSVYKRVTMYLHPDLKQIYTVTTSPTSQPKPALSNLESTENDVTTANSAVKAKVSSSTSNMPVSLNANVTSTTNVVETKLTASYTTTPIVSREKAILPEAPVLTDSSPAVRSKKSKSQKSTSRSEKSTRTSMNLPWPRSKNACIIIPKIKNVSRVDTALTMDELWKYALLPMPENLLTSLKSLRSWLNETNVEKRTHSCSSPRSSTNFNPVDFNDQSFPDFQEIFQTVLNEECWKCRQSWKESSLPLISKTSAAFSSLSSDSLLLPSQSKGLSRLRRLNLSSEKQLLPRKSYFLSTISASPLATVPEVRRSTCIEYEYTSPNKVTFDTYEEVVPLCLLGDTFTITGVSAEEKYAALSTISPSDSDSDTETSRSSSAYSSGES